VSRDPAALEALVTQRTRAAGSSFFWAMRFLEPTRRLAMYAVYAFCREIDDIVDEAGSDEEKIRRLDEWERDLALLYGGREPRQDLAAALLPAIDRYALPVDDFIAVIAGCRMDVGAGVVRPSMEQLDLYCDRVAAAVGRLSVRVFGDFDAKHSIELANHQGRALQLTNILRDVAVDAEIGRLYLPDELLSKHGINGTDVAAVLAHPNLPIACAELAELARYHFTQARAALRHASRRAVRPAILMLEMYWRIWLQCRKLGWRPQSPVLGLPKRVKLWCALRYGLFAGV